ncbi:signal peptidase I [Tepidibacillus infernus]|uniref:Signal peptidase I n=1 Tax=Tepidibacillus decaturensis TaxID=1413211 RepID=A0A135L442_9BACI|nr:MULTISPECIES: signal peptidase I [Tepidibacillus]KXG43679.1 S26 family signal peptidase [Tepidibacillus decaturensis]GBF11651.1 signal peptidase I S [Tepidibacillus sp. HK-1]
MSSSINKELKEWAKAIAIAIILAYLIRTFLFAPFIVDGTSMMPTLENGERLIVNELQYRFGQPKRGDIIVFRYSEEQDYIKRVIALPGEVVEVKNDQLYINGQKVEEPYLNEERKQLAVQGLTLTDDFGPVKVEEGHLFVMGDNRRNSKDSRMIGTIKFDQVVGKAAFAFWPISEIKWLTSK